jgi:hypothetical protein
MTQYYLNTTVNARRYIYKFYMCKFYTCNFLDGNVRNQFIFKTRYYSVIELKAM